MEAFQQALTYDPSAQVFVAKVLVVVALFFYTNVE